MVLTASFIAKATFDAISKTYSYLTPDLWKETVFTKSPYQVGKMVLSLSGICPRFFSFLF